MPACRCGTDMRWAREVTTMAADRAVMEEIAGQITSALHSADLAGYRDLLDPDVTWGAPDDSNPGCRSRDQVLAWCRRGRARGVRALVTETGVYGDTILVGLRVSDESAPAGSRTPTDRWQVLTVRDGLVADIRGFDDRAEAMARLS